MIEQLIRFCVVGGSGLVVDFSLTYLLKEKLKTNKYIANSVGFVVAATSNYVLNRVWTFNSTDPKIALQYLVFVSIALVGLLINNAIVYVLNDKVHLNFYFSKLVAIGVVTFWNFFMNYFFTFS